MTQPDVDQLHATLPGRLALWARRTPDRVALRNKRFGVWREITWRAYYEHVQTVGYMLWKLGVRPGDHVALLSENRPEWLYVDLGVQGIGARSVGIYQTNPPADVAYILNHSKSVILFCEDQEQVDKAIEVAEETSTVRQVVVFEPRGTRTYADPRLMTWDDFLSQGEELRQGDSEWFEQRLLELDPAAPSMVVYTSGTTGQPKGAMLSSRNALFGADRFVEITDVSEDDQLLSYLPLCHVAEKIFSEFGALAVGYVMHFGESIDTVREDVREVSPTIFLGVPRIWEKMHSALSVKMQDSSWLKRKLYTYFATKGQEIARRRMEGALSLQDRMLWSLGDLLVYRALQERLGLRRCTLPGSGAAPISPEMLWWFHGIGIPVREGYGQTECGGVSHFNRDGATRIGTVGQAVPQLECRLADDGEILLRAPGVFVGYLHNPEATAETVDADGWLHTGDIGQTDEDGFLTITGRKKEIIITSGGKNISPERVENALKMSPFINEAVAIGDSRKFVAALIQIEYDLVANWASQHNIQYTSFPDLSGKSEVHKLVSREVERCNDLLSHVEQVKAFRLFPNELNQDEGELTATRKVRRRAIHQAYGELIDSIYAS